jgi:hypothetical protein
MFSIHDSSEFPYPSLLSCLCSSLPRLRLLRFGFLSRELSLLSDRAVSRIKELAPTNCYWCDCVPERKSSGMPRVCTDRLNICLAVTVAIPWSRRQALCNFASLHCARTCRFKSFNIHANCKLLHPGCVVITDNATNFLCVSEGCWLLLTPLLPWDRIAGVRVFTDLLANALTVAIWRGVKICFMTVGINGLCHSSTWQRDRHRAPTCLTHGLSRTKECV